MEPGSVFWDVGANVGVLSLYAAQRGDLDVHAFEPAAANYHMLAANCELNGFEDVLSCYMLGFGDRTLVSRIEASQFAAGASFKFKGTPDEDSASSGHHQTSLLFSIDDFVERFDVPLPNYLKIDVPGLKSEILAGAARVLTRMELRELQLEIREDSRGGRQILESLAAYGFHVVHRNRRLDGRVKEVVLGRVGHPMSGPRRHRPWRRGLRTRSWPGTARAFRSTFGTRVASNHAASPQARG